MNNTTLRQLNFNNDNKLNIAVEEKADNTLQQLFRCYEVFLSDKFGKKKNVLMHLRPLKELIIFNGKRPMPISDITEEFLIEFQKYLYEERGFKIDTVKWQIKSTGLFFDYLISDNITKDNSAGGVEIIQEPVNKPLIQRYYSFEELLRRYINQQRRWVSFEYLTTIQKHLKVFFEYLGTQDQTTVYRATEAIILRYRNYLWNEYENQTESSITVKSQRQRLRLICRFFSYLQREGIIISDPCKNLSWEAYYKQIFEKAKNLPKKEKPQKILTPLEELKVNFLEYETTKGKVRNTINSYKRGLDIFFEYLDKKGIYTMAQVEKRTLLNYYTCLYSYRSKKGEEVSSGSKARYLWTVKTFCKFLTRFDYIDKDPAFDLEPIKEERGLPRTCMNEREVLKLLDMPNLNNVLGMRDKAIMEALFSTGARVDELCHLNIEDIDYVQGTARINKAKGGNSYQRVIPIGKVALTFLSRYLREARPKIEASDRQALFLSYSGRRINTEAVWKTVKKYAFEAGIRKPVTPHSFRVTCATLMLRNGADIRYVQEQLGHKRITSTQIYTRLMPCDLKIIHARCHPRERKNNSDICSLQHLSGGGTRKENYSENSQNIAVG